jgi:hypothetical protein
MRRHVGARRGWPTPSGGLTTVANGGVWAALLTAGVSRAAVALALALAHLANR